MTDGLVNVLKVPGMTSSDVVNIIRGIYHTKKVGHAGTLDPEAAGVLPIFIGSATRLLEYAVSGTKHYRAEALAGIRTDTGDDTGKLLETMPVPDLTPAMLKEALAKFVGDYQQVPPMYSALKHNGRKLYQYARAGVEIPREPRTVQIDRLVLTGVRPPFFIFEVECSKGTYVRTLIEDIGRSLGTCATMTFLLRESVGGFNLSEAKTIEEIEACPEAALQPLETAVRHLPRLQVNPLQGLRITSGVKTTIPGTPDGRYALYDGGQFLAIVLCKEEKVQALKVLYHSSYSNKETNE